MIHTTLNENQLKDLLKQAIIEILQDKRSFLYDTLAEVLEDMGLVNAIKEGDSSELVSKEDVFQALER